MYQLLLKLIECDNCLFKWINYVKSILDETVISEVWNLQQNVHQIFLNMFKKGIQDKFLQKWVSEIRYSSSWEFY